MAVSCLGKKMEGKNDQSGRSADPDPANDQQFIDDIYEIALDPGNLDSFIDRLESKSTDVNQTRTELLKIDALSALFKAHLARAELFLDRVKAEADDSHTILTLAPFDHCAALLVDANLKLVEVNIKALEALGAVTGDPIAALPLEGDDLDQLIVQIQRLLRSQSSQSVLIHVRTLATSSESPGKVIVFHARWLADKGMDTGSVAGRRGQVVLVSTELSWPDALDQTLHEVFGLTDAERDILRALVEGKVLKKIAMDRDRSVGTVRVQVKSILAKTRAHSQAELVRVTLSLMEVVKRAPELNALAERQSAKSFAKTALQFEPYSSLTRSGGRNMDYLVQGDPSGMPVVFTHMGYGLLRWPPAALDLARAYKLMVISPVRPGFGNSDPVGRHDDILQIIREDTAALLDHLGIRTCTYVVQGNDMLFALDFLSHYRSRVSGLIGLGVRLPLPTNLQYPGMGKWHRFLLSNARHAPHLLYFTCKAAFLLGRKIGREQMFFSVHKNSQADLALADDAEIAATLIESSKLALGETHHAAFAYAKELLETESNWRHRVDAARNVPGWYVSGLQDSLSDAQTLATYRRFYPWIEIEQIADAGQLLFFQKFPVLIPRIAHTASGN